MLITHPAGGRSFDYADYWDRKDLIYTGRGLDGDQRLKGANLDVAENRRRLLVFEHAGPKELTYLGDVVCVDYWEAMAPDRSGRDRRVYRFRLRNSDTTRRFHEFRRSAPATERSRPRDRSRGRDPSSFRPRPFDPDREATRRRPGQVSDPDQKRVLAEQADKNHQATLRALGLWLSANGWADLEEIDGATDLLARRNSRRALFEVKTISPSSERGRVRAGLAQLLEYRFFLGSQQDLLCLVTNGPIGDRRLQLLDALGIGHGYIKAGKLHLSGTRATGRVFLRYAS